MMITNPVEDYLSQAKRGGAPNPFYVVSTQFLPRNFNDVIRWSRFVITQSPTLMEVIRKLATYPITEFIINTPNKAAKDKYTKILKSIRLKSFLNEVGFDHYTLGNVYISIYFPINRFLQCPTCYTEYKYEDVKDSIRFKNYIFEGACKKCQHSGAFTRIDRKSMDIEDMNLIRWPVENVSVHRNPITNKTDYYYTIPNYVKKGIMIGDPTYITGTPWSIIEAVKDNKDYKFDNKNFYHFKNITLGDLLNGYGIPPLISIYSLVYYQALLRRANEAIATEHLTPLRFVSPKQGSGTTDPGVVVNLSSFASKIEENLKKFKKDPNHIAISPVPVDITNMGGEGRALLISQELQFAEETILMGLGVPRELMAGTINWTSSTVGLRLLENTLNNYLTQVRELIEWIVTKINAYFNISDVEIDMVPFKLIDDDATRQQLAALLERGQVSVSTYLKAFGLDLDEELDQMKKDEAKLAAFGIEKEHIVAVTKFAKAKDMASNKTEDDDYAKSMELAQQYFQQIMANQDPNAQKAALMQLRQEDPGLYQQVVTMIEQYQNTPTTQDAAAQPDPTDPNAEQQTGDQQGAPADQAQADDPAQQEQPAAEGQVPPNRAGDEGKVK